MGYLATMLANTAGQKLGTPPSRQSPNVGVPPAQPHIEPAPYDVANDPGWRGIIDPNDHELRNFLNEITPEQRQMLIQRLSQLGKIMAPGGGPPGVPPNTQVPVPRAPLPTGQVPV